MLRCVRKKLPDAATVIRMSAYVYKKIAERKSMHKKQEKGVNKKLTVGVYAHGGKYFWNEKLIGGEKR